MQPWPLAEEVPWTRSPASGAYHRTVDLWGGSGVCATGITDGDILHGVRYYGARAVTHSHRVAGQDRYPAVIETSHNLRRKTPSVPKETEGNTHFSTNIL